MEAAGPLAPGAHPARGSLSELPTFPKSGRGAPEMQELWKSPLGDTFHCIPRLLLTRPYQGGV